MNGLATVRSHYFPGAYVPAPTRLQVLPRRTAIYRLPAPSPRLRTSRGMADNFDWPAAIVGIYQVYQQSVNQARQDDLYVDDLRDQVYRAIYSIRQRIKQGDVSPTVAAQAGQEIVSSYHGETQRLPRAQARQRAASYEPTMNAYAAINGFEAALYYQKYRCPESTHTTNPCNVGSAGCEIVAADLANCVPLSAATVPGGSSSPGGTTPSGGGSVPPVAAGSNLPGASILDVLGSVNVLGMEVPILPAALIGVILLMQK